MLLPFGSVSGANRVKKSGDTMTGKLIIANSGGNNQIDLTSSGGPSIIRDTVSGDGLSLQGNGVTTYGKLRIVTNSIFQDAVDGAYFQIDTSGGSRYALFYSGDYGSDNPFNRLGFSSTHTTFSDGDKNNIFVAPGVVLVQAHTDLQVLQVKANATQTNKIFEVTDSSNNDYLSVDGSGNTAIGSAALATTATNGFFYVDTCAGAPTGVPTTITGRVPMIYDTTNNNFYIYNGAWKKVGLA